MVALCFDLLVIMGGHRSSDTTRKTLMMLALNMLVKTMTVVMGFTVSEAFGLQRPRPVDS